MVLNFDRAIVAASARTFRQICECHRQASRAPAAGVAQRLGQRRHSGDQRGLAGAGRRSRAVCD